MAMCVHPFDISSQRRRSPRHHLHFPLAVGHTFDKILVGNSGYSSSTNNHHFLVKANQLPERNWRLSGRAEPAQHYSNRRCMSTS